MIATQQGMHVAEKATTELQLIIINDFCHDFSYSPTVACRKIYIIHIFPICELVFQVSKAPKYMYISTKIPLPRVLIVIAVFPSRSILWIPRLSWICQMGHHVIRRTLIPRINAFGHRNKAARIVSFTKGFGN